MKPPLSTTQGVARRRRDRRRWGFGSLTIRSLARELGVKPMSVYDYVANNEILECIVDFVFSEIE